MSVDRKDRDDHALLLFMRMLDRRPVWVDSEAGQMTWVQSIGLDDSSGECIAFDRDWVRSRASRPSGPDDTTEMRVNAS